MTIKIEMRGTGGGRWSTRAEAKDKSKKLRRRVDKAEVKLNQTLERRRGKSIQR